MSRLLVTGVAVVLATTATAGADWPAWRGSLGSGVSTETGLPERWSSTENVAWTARLAGVGVSSPVVAGDQVYITSQVGTGVRQPGSHPRLAQGASAADAGERAQHPAARAEAEDQADHEDHRRGDQVSQHVAENHADQGCGPPDRHAAEAVEDALLPVDVESETRVHRDHHDARHHDAREQVLQVVPGRAGQRATE